VRARDDHRGDLARHCLGQLTGRALDGSPGLRVRVEQVTADQDQVDLLGDGQVDRPLERAELPLTLVGRGRPEIVVPSSKVHIGHVQQTRHIGRFVLRGW
jgi:hypothetical protein